MNNRRAYKEMFQPLCYQLNCLMCCTIVGVKPASERREKVYPCGNYAIVFCYYCFKCLINVSLSTGWPFAKVRPELV